MSARGRVSVYIKSPTTWNVHQSGGIVATITYRAGRYWLTDQRTARDIAVSDSWAKTKAYAHTHYKTS